MELGLPLKGLQRHHSYQECGGHGPSTTFKISGSDRIIGYTALGPLSVSQWLEKPVLRVSGDWVLRPGSE